jgi:hypothetical protein
MYQVTKDEREPDAVLKWKARACRFLGHDKDSNTYTVWDIESHKRIEGRSDVIWDATLVEQWIKSSNNIGEEDVEQEYSPEADFDGPDLIPGKKSDDEDDYDEEEPHYWQNTGNAEYDSIAAQAYIQYELFHDENPDSDSIIHRLNAIREDMAGNNHVISMYMIIVKKTRRICIYIKFVRLLM